MTYLVAVCLALIVVLGAFLLFAPKEEFAGTIYVYYRGDDSPILKEIPEYQRKYPEYILRLVPSDIDKIYVEDVDDLPFEVYPEVNYNYYGVWPGGVYGRRLVPPAHKHHAVRTRRGWGRGRGGGWGRGGGGGGRGRGRGGGSGRGGSGRGGGGRGRGRGRGT